MNSDKTEIRSEALDKLLSDIQNKENVFKPETTNMKPSNLVEKNLNLRSIPNNSASVLYLNLLTDKLSMVKDSSMINVSPAYRVYKNIYITDSETPEINDWVLVNGHDYPKKCIGFEEDGSILLDNNLPYDKEASKKVILTTDVVLIAHGVQLIETEFLEWFIEHPTCERVETIKAICPTSYLIQIPQPETNEDQPNKKEEYVFTPPFRVGRSQNRAVLDANSRELVIFPVGNEKHAQEYCDYLNNKHNTEQNNPNEIKYHYIGFHAQLKGFSQSATSVGFSVVKMPKLDSLENIMEMIKEDNSKFKSVIITSITPLTQEQYDLLFPEDPDASKISYVN